MDAKDEGGVLQIPPSQLRRFRFHDDETEVLARYAKLIPGDPDRLFLFAAREVNVHGVEIKPPYQFGDDSDWSAMSAYYAGHEQNTVVYFVENWGDEAATGLPACYLILELHELTHWAILEEENETDTDHWLRWNRVIADAVSYVMDIEEWDVSEYKPPEIRTETAQETCRQTTLEDVITP